MSAHVLAISDDRHDPLRGTLLLSMGLHIALLVGAVVYTLIGFHLSSGPSWGTEGAVRMGAVATLPGVPLPAPMVMTHSTVATQNTGQAVTEPPPKEETPPEAQPIPKFKDAVKPEKLERVNKRIQPKIQTPPPDNVVPYGETGAPEMNYTTVVTSGGEIGTMAGENNSFGQQFGWYVASMRSRISANWLQSTISPGIVTAPRVYLTFEIKRDGTVSDVQITQSSGVPEVDRSAFRAILASNPLPPLPAGYSGGSVNVQFYFDFHR